MCPDDPKRRLSEEFTRTVIDLGEDLLKSDGPAAPSEYRDAPAPEEALRAPRDEAEVSDLLQSASILMGEGLLDEAKKVLRRIILSEPKHVAAREKLDQIHEIELKQIFSEGYLPRSTRKKPSALDSVDAERVMQDLDHDLGLGLFKGPGLESEPDALEQSLFPDARSRQRFSESLSQSLSGASARDRMDLGIGFMEMGLLDLAIAQFRTALKGPECALAATSLLVEVLIQAGRCFEATQLIEPVLRDSEINAEDKIAFFYLMGRATEAQRKSEVALSWYQQAYRLDRGYRDVPDRIRKLMTGGGGAR